MAPPALSCNTLATVDSHVAPPPPIEQIVYGTRPHQRLPEAANAPHCKVRQALRVEIAWLMLWVQPVQSKVCGGRVRFWPPRGHILLIHYLFCITIINTCFWVAPLQIMTLDRVRALGYKHPRPHHPPKARAAGQGLWLCRHACSWAEQVQRERCWFQCCLSRPSALAIYRLASLPNCPWTRR